MALTSQQIDWLNSYARLTPVIAMPKGDVLEDEGKDDTPGEDEDADGEDADALAALRLEYDRKREDEELADADRKDMLLTQSSDAVYAYKDVLRAAFDFEMGTKRNRDAMRDDKHGRQEDEVDQRDISKRAKGGDKIHAYGKDKKENDALITQASKAYQVVVKEKARLTSAMTERSRLEEKQLKIVTLVVPLFTTDEVTDLFFAPLVRGRLIPDGAITDDFSATQRMLDATSKLYIDNDLAGASDPKSNIDQLAATGAGIAGGVANLVTSQFGVDTTMVKELIEAGTALVTLGVSATTLALGIEEKDVSDLAGKVPEILGKLVGAATGNEAIGDAISGAGSAGVKAAVKTIQKLKGKQVGAGDIGNLVRDCVADILKAAASSVPECKAELTLVADALGTIDATKIASIGAGLQKGDWKMVSSGIFAMLSDFAGSVGTMTSDAGGVAKTQLSDALTGGLEEGGKIVGEALALVGDLLTAKDANDVAAKLESAVPDILGEIVGTLAGDDIGALVTATAKGAASVGDLILKKARGEDISPDDIGAALGDCIDAAFGAATYGVTSANPEGADTINDELEAVGEQLKKAAEAFGKSKDAETLLSGSPSDRKKAAGKLLLQLLLNMPSAAGSLAGASGTDQGTALAEKMEQASGIIDTLSEAGEEVSENLKKVQEDVEAIKKELEQEHDKDAEEDADAIIDEAEKERAEYQKLIRSGLQDTKGQEAILKLIKKMKRDEMILKSAIALGSAGLEVAAQFFAPLAIGKEILKMTAHMAAAIQRAVDLKRMLDAQDWAESGVSKYRSPIDNFVKNQGEQLSEHSIKAAMCALRVAAEVAATAYPQAKPVATAATLAQSTVDLGFSAYKEADLRRAWKTTKEALSDPTNRKLGLKARRLNATLAKWCIAYGATTEKDPVAVKTMNEVGLTNQMLQSEGVGEKLVKQFLEARFPEDAKVTFKWDTSVAWQAKLPTPELTSTSIFKSFSVMAGATGEFFEKPPTVVKTPPNAMVGSLNKYQDQSKSFKSLAKTADGLREAGKKPDAKEDEITAFRDALKVEIEAGKDVLRLANIFKAETTKVVGGIRSLKADKSNDSRALEGLKSSLSDVVAAYRSMAEDEIDMLESDLLTPMIEFTRAEAALKAAKTKATAKPEPKHVTN